MPGATYSRSAARFWSRGPSTWPGDRHGAADRLRAWLFEPFYQIVHQRLDADRVVVRGNSG